MPLTRMSDSKWVNRSIWMQNSDISRNNGTLICNFLECKIDLPSPDRKFNGVGVTFIFFSRHSKSKIQSTSIMCRRLFIWDITTKIKIYFAALLIGVTGIGSDIWSIFFEKIGRLLKYPIKSACLASHSKKPRQKSKKQEKVSLFMHHSSIVRNFLP